jgi:hypothetical protein
MTEDVAGKLANKKTKKKPPTIKQVTRDDEWRHWGVISSFLAGSIVARGKCRLFPHVLHNTYRRSVKR